MSWIDVSLPLRPEMLVWPGDDAVRVEQTRFIDRGDAYNLTFLAMSAHTGTHVDAPRHFIDKGADLGALPLAAMLGEAWVVEVGDAEVIRPEHIPAGLERGARVLFKTRNSREYLKLPYFVENYVYISREAAETLVAAGVQTVGIDYLSVGGFHTDLVDTHEVLLGAGIWLIECLDLAAIAPGRYEMACLPLHIPGADGAPARACLRPL